MFNPLPPLKRGVFNIITIMFPTIASSLISGLFGMSNQNQMIQQQKKENELSFQRNMQLAQQQNAMNIAQWNRANEYNLPINEVKRLKQAGLSPALLYKGGASFGSSPSPTLTAGTPYTPVDHTLGGQRKTIGDIASYSLDMALKKAQVDNLKADSAKKQSEKTGIDITNQSIFDLNLAEIQNKLSQAGLNKAQTDKVAYEIQSIQKSLEVADEQIKVWQAQTANMSVQQAQKWFELQIQKNVSDAQIRDLCSSADLKEAQAKEILDLLPQKLANLMADTNLKDSQSQLAMANVFLTAAQEVGVIQENDIREVDRLIALNVTNHMGNDEDSLASHWAGTFSYVGKIISGFLPIMSKIK